MITVNTRQGDRVLTPQGPGTVAYIRLGGPDYSSASMLPTVTAVSVVLDAKRGTDRYTGSIYAAEDVTLLPKDPA